MPKTKPKPKVAKKAAKKVAAKRHHAPIPHRSVAKKTAPRQRETQTKKERPAMTTAKDDSPRGAGSGEHANATRDRKSEAKSYTPGPEYDEGDPAKGKLDPEALAEAETVEQIPMRDRRAYLLDQAAKNESANDELNAIQVEQNKRLQFAQAIIQDPDRMREESMETAITALKMHDPDTIKKNAEAAQKNAEKSPKYTPSPTTPDFKAGQASG
jgi:hypothetical protein